MPSLFELFAILLLLAAGFGWMNVRFLHLPSNVALLLMGILTSLSLFLFDLLFPGFALTDDFRSTLRTIDFSRVLMQGALGFLLFAGALHVDWLRLKQRLSSVAVLATVGVLISTLLTGLGFWILASLLGVNIDLTWALVFGALISPTDPIAVLSLLRSARVPKSLETEIAGESLFNDGIGVVLFTLLLAMANDSEISFPTALTTFLVETLGGGLIGISAGYLAYRAMRAIDDYVVEVLISLALVTTVYSVANLFGTSGPIAVVIAGLLIGERGPTHAMSANTQRYLFGFWKVVDDILNSILFLLIGLELVVIGFDSRSGWIAICAIALVVGARFAAIGIPVAILSYFTTFVRGSIPIIVWCGVRGGISIALSLSIPANDQRPTILAATYLVVVFTVVVQGLSIKRVIRALVPSTVHR